MIINIVEDSASIKNVWQKLLERTAYREWRFWTSGPDDVDALLETEPEIVVLRGTPKHQTVMAMIHQLAPAVDHQGCKLVVVSSSEQDRLAHHLDINAIDAVLPMPFTLDKVERMLDQFTAQLMAAKRKRPLAVIVDDSVVARKLIQQSISEHGYDTLEADNGLAGLELIGMTIPDIVLADIEMPDMDGLTMCEHLSHTPKTSHIPIIVISGIVDQAMMTRGFSSGASEFLKKPFTSQQLTNAVSSLTKSVFSFQNANAFVLEDNRAVASIVQKFLRHLGVRSTVCRTMAELYNNLEITVPDLITIDLTLPDGNGRDVCRRIRSTPEFSSIPLMVVSAEVDRGVMIECLEIGADDYIMKPFMKTEFCARINNILRTKRLQDELQQKVHMLENLAFVDGLTGLFNRLSLDKGIEKEIALAAERKIPLGLCLIDLDDFKQVNDTHGHDVGDEMLKEVSDTIKKSIRATDIACRYGGEEICVLLPGCDISAAHRRAMQICKIISRGVYTRKKLNQTVSIGVSVYPTLSPHQRLIKDADTALYEAKRAGKNRVYQHGGVA